MKCLIKVTKDCAQKLSLIIRKAPGPEKISLVFIIHEKAEV